MDIQVKNLDHLGIVAGIVDQIGLDEEIDTLSGFCLPKILSAALSNLRNVGFSLALLSMTIG